MLSKKKDLRFNIILKLRKIVSKQGETVSS